MKMAVTSSAIVRLENAMKTTLAIWCDEVRRIVDEYGIKELQNVLPVIVDFIFELSAPTGWSLRTLTKSHNSRDFESVFHLLSPRGPIFSLCYKLLTDGSLKYDFSLNYIPTAVRQLLEEGVVPSFYVGKLQYHPQLRIPSSLALNSLEYYMMHFLFYLVNPNLQKYCGNSAGSDSVYFAILEEYLQYFLPCTGIDPDPIPSPSHLSHFGSPVFSPPPKPRFESPRTSMTPSLLKKSALTPSSGTGPTSLSAERCGTGQQHDSCWRTMLLLQAINELWLSHVTSRENYNLQRAGSPSRNHSQINVLQTTVFIPTLDHLRGVRMVTKHLHYFANSMGPNIISGIDELKRTVWTYFQKKLYIFLRHTLEHWPLDASFRLFLETWLSYIQPWRYVSNGAAQPKSSSGDSDKIVDFRWQNFVAENLLFFTQFMRKVLVRFLRVELSSSKTSLMLYRISKVYSQRNLKHMIASAEASLTESSGTGPKSLVPGVCTPSHLSATVRQYINELEGPSFSYVPLFGPDTTVLIRNVLTAAVQAKANLRASQIQQRQDSAEKTGGSWLVRLFHWFLSPAGSIGGEDNSEEIKKALGHLESASAQLAAFYDVELPEEPEPDTIVSRTLGTPVRSVTNVGTQYGTPVRSMMDSTLLASPISPQRRYDIIYRGNIDTQPIRSYEITFLVRLLHQISCSINEKFGYELEHMYHRTDFPGRVVRQLLAPPADYQEVIKSYGTPRVIEKRLPPRVCLRFLANQQIVGLFLALLLGSYAFGLAPEILLLFVVCAILAVLFVRASLATYRDRQGNISIENDESSFVRSH